MFQGSKIGYNTLLAHHTSSIVLHPIFTFYGKEIHQQSGGWHFHPASLNWILFTFLSVNLRLITEILPEYSSLNVPFPCDMQLVNLRTLELPQEYSAPGVSVKPQKEQALLLHRFVVDCRSGLSFPSKCNSTDGEVSLHGFLSRNKKWQFSL